MFSKRRNISRNYKFDRRFLEKLVSDLREANFKSITVKLPPNLINFNLNVFLIKNNSMTLINE